MLTVQQRVDNGIRWLDARDDLGTWEPCITRETLKMSNPCDCICGAIFGKEGDTPGREKDQNGFMRAKAMVEADGLNTIDLGFSSNGAPGDYAELKKEWLRRVNDRI